MVKEFDVNKLEVEMIVEYKTREKRIVLRDSEGNLFLSGIDSYKSDMSHFIDNTEIPKEVELTMQEIADKFGIPIELLKIKK